ncbi:hypothetical protein A3K79_00895 [Candidatus Bathyarchaeota archaeon RBG_13_46_16b]|nr:MAG: hypothetical protein A3K79_00895 [Candidatus Bathyarchaeota archaeon RBG_13_46_16b]
MKFWIVAMLAMTLMTLNPVRIQNARAYWSGANWWGTWEQYQYHTDDPENASTLLTVQSTDGKYHFKLALMSSIYQYEPYDVLDLVNFRLCVFFDSFKDDLGEQYAPPSAGEITIFIEKDPAASDPQLHAAELDISELHPFSQGSGLHQHVTTPSTYEERYFWAGDAIGEAISLLLEEVPLLGNVISLAGSYFSSPGLDYENLEYTGNTGYLWWDAWDLDFNSANPVRQVGFNKMCWFQERTNPTSFYGLKIWARVFLDGPAKERYGQISYDTLPIRLQIHRAGGGGGAGGCPILYVWNGYQYAGDALLDIHNPNGTDIILDHTLMVNPMRENGKYSFRLVEHPQTHSYIDQVRLHAVCESGNMIPLPLIYASHSCDGNALLRLLFSDDWKTEIFGADWNNGTSESIDLEFLAPEFLDRLPIVNFVLRIEGNNPIRKL